MALIFADGFEHYGLGTTGRANMLAGVWAEITNGSGGYPCEIMTTQKRSGSNSLRIGVGNASNSIVRRVFPTTKYVVGVGYGAYLQRLPTVNTVNQLKIRDGANNDILTFVIQSDGSIVARRGTEAGTILAITDSIIGPLSWNHIEVACTIDNIVGSFEVRVNGIVVIKTTNQNLGVAPAASVVWYARGNTNNGEDNFYIDDIFAWDDTGTFNKNFIGQARIQTLFPNADTAQADWSVTGAVSGFAAINQSVPDGDTTFISGNALGNKSDFGLPVLPTEVLDINGVYVPVMAKSADAGISSIKMSMKHGADLAAGPEIPLTTAYTYWPSVFEVDPSTGLKWTKAGFEASFIRAEKTT